MTTVTMQAATRLEHLAKNIRQLHESTERIKGIAKAKCNETVAEAILCGKALNEAKALVVHGNWLPWLKKNCPKITERTAQNYMRLANTKHVSDLKQKGSLRQAYIAVGIIDDEEPVIPELPAKPQEAVTPPPRPYIPPAPAPAKPAENRSQPLPVQTTPRPAPATSINVEHVLDSAKEDPAIVMVESWADEGKARLQGLTEEQRLEAKVILKMNLPKWVFE